MSGEWRGKQDVFIQDQTTELLDLYLSEKINDVTLADFCLSGQETCTLVAGHGVVIGDWLEFWEFNFSFQVEVTNVVGDVITMAMPMDIGKTPGAIVRRTNVHMNVDGSGTDVIFSFAPVGDIQYDVVRTIINMSHDSSGADSKFGNIAALTVGMYSRVIIPPLDLRRALWNIKTNGDLRIRAYDLAYSDKAGPGLHGTSWRRTFGGSSKNGVVIRINPHLNVELQLVVRDDLTALDDFKTCFQGHKVD